MAGQFVFFKGIFAEQSNGEGFTVLPDGTLIVVGNQFQIPSQSYLTQLDVDGDVLARSGAGVADPHSGLRSTAIIGTANGNFFLFGNEGQGSSFTVDLRYNAFNVATLNAMFNGDTPVMSLTDNNQGYENVTYSLFHLSNGGFGVATADNLNAHQVIHGVNSYDGTASRGSDVRIKLYDASGTRLTGNFLVQNSGAALAGDQNNLHSVQLANGNIASVFYDTWFQTDPNHNDPAHQAYAVSIANTSGALVAPAHDFLQGNSIVAGGLNNGLGIAALTGGGFVVVYTQEANVEEDGPHHHSHVKVQRFNASGAAVGGPVDLNSAVFGFQNNLVDNSFEGTLFSPPVVRATADGGFIVAAVTGSYYTSDPHEVGLAKFDSAGHAIAHTILPSPFAADSYSLDDMQIAPDGEILLKLFDGSTSRSEIVSYLFTTSNDVVQNAPTHGGTLHGQAAANGTDWLRGSISADTLIGGAAAGRLFGEGGNDHLTGGAKNDMLYGGAGLDTLNGGAGADRMFGGSGNDTYFVDNIGDKVSEGRGQGTDRVNTHVSYVLAVGSEVETLAADNLTATSAINLIGNEFRNTLIGNDGNNVLTGGAGIDTMIGNGGNDTYHVDSGADVVKETPGDGSDRVYTTVSYALTAGSSIELLSAEDVAGKTALSLFGNDYANKIVGNAGSNVLKDGGLLKAHAPDPLGHDDMSGLGGNDSYYVFNSTDVIHETEATAANPNAGGTDRVYAHVSYTLGAGVSVETLLTDNNAATSALNLTGNNLANAITGNAGANRINGSAGNDALTGLGGHDTFVFNTALSASANVDRITDFHPASSQDPKLVDKIELDHHVFAKLTVGALPATAFFTGPAAHDDTDRIIYNSATGALSYDPDGTFKPDGVHSAPAVVFAVLPAHLALSQLDFHVV